MMIRKFIYTISVLSVFLAVSCDGALPEEGDGFGTAENESFVENPITDQNATRLWSTPALPDAGIWYVEICPGRLEREPSSLQVHPGP